MAEAIKPNYAAMSANDYAARINTPAQNPFYHAMFHAPLIEELAQKGVKDPTLVDMAAGHGHELEPIVAINSGVRLVAVDVSRNVLTTSTKDRIGARKLFTLDPSAEGVEEKDSDGLRETIVKNTRELIAEVLKVKGINLLIAADVENIEGEKEGFADAGIALNAVVYKPYQMLRALRSCLRTGAPASVNFRDESNPHNRAFYDFYLKDGGVMEDGQVELGNGVVLPTRVLDYRQHPDLKIRALDRQTYFANTADMESIISATGFDIEGHEKFEFASPANPNNQIDVFRLRAA